MQLGGTIVQRRYQILICYILMILMSYTGICIDSMQADSLLRYGALGKAARACVMPVDEVISQEEACTQEALGISKTSIINNLIEKCRIRRNLKNVWSLLTAYLSAHRVVNLHMAECELRLHSASCKTVILNYIHDQDGKK